MCDAGAIERPLSLILQLIAQRRHFLLGRLAGRTGQVLNLSQASSGLAVDRSTIEEYTRLLEDLFLLQRLPAWGHPGQARNAGRHRPDRPAATVPGPARHAGLRSGSLLPRLAAGEAPGRPSGLGSAGHLRRGRRRWLAFRDLTPAVCAVWP